MSIEDEYKFKIQLFIELVAKMVDIPNLFKKKATQSLKNGLGIESNNDSIDKEGSGSNHNGPINW
jgi:hypothetical protein